MMTETKNTTGARETEETNGWRSPNYRDNKGILVAFLLAAALFFFFVHLGDPRRGVAAAGAGGMIVMTIRSRWDLRKRVWFWAMIAVFVLAHVPLILRVHWPDTGNMPAVSLMPFGIMDWGIMYGCIKLVEKVTKWRY